MSVRNIHNNTWHPHYNSVVLVDLLVIPKCKLRNKFDFQCTDMFFKANKEGTDEDRYTKFH